MKQEIISYIYSIKDEMNDLSHFLYENPEDSLNYLSKLLTNKNFKFERNFMGISTSFISTFGHGHPKICFLCEYDAKNSNDCIYGNNLSTAISVTAALSLSKITAQNKGSIILVGIPVNHNCDALSLLDKQNAFEDVDVLMLAQLNKFTSCDYATKAQIKFKIVFHENENSTYNMQDSLLLFLAILPHIKPSSNVKINLESINSLNNEAIINLEGLLINDLNEMKKNYEIILATIEKLTSLKIETMLISPPYEELVVSKLLNRIFSHNLKESGVIDINNDIVNSKFSSLGCISKKIPCISSHIALTKDYSIIYPSKEFQALTLKEDSIGILIKASQALAFTGLDLIEKPSLLLEIRSELSSISK